MKFFLFHSSMNISIIANYSSSFFCRVQYQFEDEPFDTVPDLITFYVGSGKVISAASGDIKETLQQRSRIPMKSQ